MMDSNEGQLEALVALQEYIGNLFEDLNEGGTLSATSTTEEVGEIALLYGKKVMELSQQCTAQYRI